LQRVAQLIERIHLDLDLDRVTGMRLQSLQGRAKPACRCDVVVLDEHRVIEAEAVVHPTAAPYRVFLQTPQSGRRLARVSDTRFRALDLGDKGRCLRSDPAKEPEKVQRRPLAR